jgi:hypothetical protein
VGSGLALISERELGGTLSTSICSLTLTLSLCDAMRW